MGGSIDERELRETVTKLAHELADAHALLNTQQKRRPFGQHVFNAKELAYNLLHKLHASKQSTTAE